MSEHFIENILTIRGSKDEMDKFYSSINYQNNFDFKIEKFSPIPEKILKADLNDKFRIYHREVRRILSNEILREAIDINGLTETQYNKLREELIAEFGAYTKSEWMYENWGFVCGIEEVVTICIEDTLYRCNCIVGDAIDVFAYNLSLMFPNLYMSLDTRHLSNMYGSFTYLYHGDNCVKIDNGTTGIFVDRISNNKYQFKDFDPNDFDPYKYDPITYTVGLDRDLSLNIQGFNSENVINWDERNRYYKTIKPGEYKERKNEIDQFWLVDFE
jgi:hypothetical protein